MNEIAGIDQRGLARMRGEGLGWLADIVEKMITHDVQSNSAWWARDIMDGYRASIPAAPHWVQQNSGPDYRGGPQM